MKKVLITLLILLSFSTYSQKEYDEEEVEYETFGKVKPECQIPFTECWCEQRPNNPHCQEDEPSASINSPIWLLVMASVGLYLYKN